LTLSFGRLVTDIYFPVLDSLLFSESLSLETDHCPHMWADQRANSHSNHNVFPSKNAYIMDIFTETSVGVFYGASQSPKLHVAVATPFLTKL
jgi:hypothetical protein